MHINRGKRSIAIDLRQPDGVEIYLELVRGADVVIEAMRPGALAKRGLSFERMQEVNPRIVFCSISGYGATGPVQGHAEPRHRLRHVGRPGARRGRRATASRSCPSTRASASTPGPLYGALAILAAVIDARATGTGCAMEVAQSDAAAFFDWYRIETWKSYERPARRGVRQQVRQLRAAGAGYGRACAKASATRCTPTTDGHVLFMASEQEFWKNFCEAVGRPELFERWPGSKFADHARGNEELQAILTEIFKSRTAAEWIAFGNEHNTPIAPVNTPKTIADDPQFRYRLPWIPAERLDADMLPFPVKLDRRGAPAADPGARRRRAHRRGALLGRRLQRRADRRAARSRRVV